MATGHHCNRNTANPRHCWMGCGATRARAIRIEDSARVCLSPQPLHRFHLTYPARCTLGDQFAHTLYCGVLEVGTLLKFEGYPIGFDQTFTIGVTQGATCSHTQWQEVTNPRSAIQPQKNHHTICTLKRNVRASLSVTAALKRAPWLLRSRDLPSI